MLLQKNTDSAIWKDISWKRKGVIMTTNDHSISPLPQRIQPLPWEDLGSFLNRTARHMGYETTSWLLQPETISYQIDPRDLSTLSKQMDYDFLSHLLCRLT